MRAYPRSGLGSDNEVVLVFYACQRTPQARFSVPAGIARSGVKKSYPMIYRNMNETHRFSFIEYLLAPIAGATKANFGYAKARSAK